MKKTYNKPEIDVVELRGEFLLAASESEGSETGSQESKGNNFSSWDNDFDEENYSESNSSSNSLLD